MSKNIYLASSFYYSDTLFLPILQLKLVEALKALKSIEADEHVRLFAISGVNKDMI